MGVQIIVAQFLPRSRDARRQGAFHDDVSADGRFGILRKNSWQAP